MACVSGEIAYADVVANVNITGIGFDATEITRVTVPALPYPVYLSFEMFAAADAATVAATNPINTKGVAGIVPASALGVAPVLELLGWDRAGRGDASIAAAGLTDADRYAMGMMTEAHGGLQKLRGGARLDPYQPGDYVLVGHAPEGASRLWHVVANDNVYKGRLWAMRGR